MVKGLVILYVWRYLLPFHMLLISVKVRCSWDGLEGPMDRGLNVPSGYILVNELGIFKGLSKLARESSNREMNCDERILVFRNSSGISPGWCLGWWIKLQRFFGWFYPENLGNAWSNLYFRTSPGGHPMSIFSTRGLAWMFSLTLLASALCCRGTWRCWKIWPSSLLREMFWWEGAWGHQMEKDKHHHLLLQVVVLNFKYLCYLLPRSLGRWSYCIWLIFLKWVGSTAHQFLLFLVFSSCAFFLPTFQFKNLVKNFTIQKTHPIQIGWVGFFSPCLGQGWCSFLP